MAAETPGQTHTNHYLVNLVRELSAPYTRLAPTLIVTAASKEDAVDKALVEVSRGPLASVFGEGSETETHATDATLLMPFPESRRYNVLLTRDITESTSVEVTARTEAEAESAAIESLGNIDPAEWTIDDTYTLDDTPLDCLGQAMPINPRGEDNDL